MALTFPFLGVNINPVVAQAKKKYKVFAMPAGFSGCAFWRYRLPLGKLVSLGSDRVDILLADNADKAAKMQEIESHARDSDLISMQAPGHEDAFMLMRIYKAQGKKVVVDYDDYSFDLDKDNPRYGALGTSEIAGKWRDQENEFDLKQNIAKFEAFKKCVRYADMVSVTTDYLAGKMRELNPRVAVLPNSVDFNLWRPIPRPERLNGKIRIGWFGGDSHGADLGIFKTVIPEIIKKYKTVQLALQCPPVPQWSGFFETLPPDRVDWRGFVDLKHYTLFLAERHFDIGLCPLNESLDFNKCKSSIKFFEFSAIGAASVCQKMLPYAENVAHGKTGLLASTDQEWFDSISRLIENEQLRKGMAQQAYKYVFDNFNLDRNCRLWEKAYCDAIEETHERGKT